MFVGLVCEDDEQALGLAHGIEVVLLVVDGENKFAGRHLVVGPACDVGNGHRAALGRHEARFHPPFFLYGVSFDTRKPFQVLAFQVTQADRVLIAALDHKPPQRTMF
ncbi:hypothetical protein D3C87_1760230 [compost metagenome]